MSGFSLKPLQQAIYTALIGDATLMGIITGVFDHVPESTAYPYLVFGGIATEDGSNVATNIERVRFDVHAYSRTGGRKQTDEILERVHAVLHHAALSLSGGVQLISLRVATSRARQEDDGLTWHGVAALEALVQA